MRIVEKQKNETGEEYKIRLCKNRVEYGLTWTEIAFLLNDALGIKKAEATYRNWWHNFIGDVKHRKPENFKNNYEEDLTKTKVIGLELGDGDAQTSTIRVKLNEEQRKDKEYILKAHGYDPNEWKLVKAHQSIWNQNSRNSGITDLYSSKITVEPLNEFNWNEENVKKLFSELHREDYTPLNVKYSVNGDMLFIPLADIHFGLLATKELTGENYNTDIARDRVRYVISDILNKIQGRNISQIVFLIGNDGINSDNINNTTTKGTPQDSETNWFELIRQFTDLMIETIDMLLLVAPVKCYLVPSNHDLHSTFGVCETLKAWYREEENVEIINEATERKYFQYGENMIGFSHDAKDKNVAKIMAAEEPNMWGDTRFKYFFIAHLHHEIVSDDYGVDIRRLPTISGKSYWSNKQGYVGTKKQSQAFIFNKECGLEEILITNILD